MEIYVVQPADTINIIADKYGVSVHKLVSDNGLINPNALVLGQALVILNPQNTYIVEPGDTLASIAASSNISVLQLIRNNPFLFERSYIYPGESLVINYNTAKDIQVNGFTYVFLNRDILLRALPYLTYLSIYNYRIIEHANIVEYGDDSDIIQIAKEYNTIPLLMISAFSPTGELDVEGIYELLLSNAQHEKMMNEILQLVRQKEYSGVNLLIGNLTEYNQILYLNVIAKFSEALRNEGYIFMITLSMDYSKNTGDSYAYEKIDYHSISLLVDRMIFMQNIWGMREQPPAPVSNISEIKSFIASVTGKVSPEYISIGKPLIGYDWMVPFHPASSVARSMSLNSTLVLAYDQGAIIHLDEESQTPYFNYIRTNNGAPENHIVWFIDARSIRAIDDVIIDYDLIGTGLWNISSYNQLVFSIINATFNIIKLDHC